MKCRWPVPCGAGLFAAHCRHRLDKWVSVPHTRDMNTPQPIARYTILVTATAHCNERLTRTAQTLAEAIAMADGFMTHPVTDKAEVFDRWANKRYEATRQVVAA